MLDFGLGYYGVISAGMSELGVPVLTQVHAGPGRPWSEYHHSFP